MPQGWRARTAFSPGWTPDPPAYDGIGLEMKSTDDHAIAEIVRTFYGAFDNREPGRVDEARLRRIFAATATITRLSAGSVERLDLAEFVEPRLKLLNDGSLVEFHEWELEGDTVILGDIASRWSVYRKQGVLHGAPFIGGGKKLLQLHRHQRSWVISALLWQDD